MWMTNPLYENITKSCNINASLKWKNIYNYVKPTDYIGKKIIQYTNTDSKYIVEVEVL